jgi:hypothetical protein
MKTVARRVLEWLVLLLLASLLKQYVSTPLALAIVVIGGLWLLGTTPRIRALSAEYTLASTIIVGLLCGAAGAFGWWRLVVPSIRSELAALLSRNTDISEMCQKDERPKGFSCMDEYLHWLDQTTDYISKNMEPSYLARFKATMGTHMEYKSMPSGKFLTGQDSDAVNLLHFTAETLDKFIREFQN